MPVNRYHCEQRLTVLTEVTSSNKIGLIVLCDLSQADVGAWLVFRRDTGRCFDHFGLV